jgi:FtsP/CotA-like multicopper oxidase with cupredoxin domain
MAAGSLSCAGSAMSAMTFTRRSFVQALSALALGSFPYRARSDPPPGSATPGPTDWCGSGGSPHPLFVPGDRGFLGRLALDEQTLTLRAAPLRPGGVDTGPLTLAYFARHDGREYVNPTLVLRPGQRVRIELDNGLDEATIVHWHGLAVDTHNDGAGLTLAAPGARYAYDFELRNRGALYWYHPHPHGMAAGQLYRGLFGAIEISDDDEAKLRAAPDLVPGKSEIALLLQDRLGSDYAPSPMDQTHGYLGDTVYVNGTACPYLDVATRLYRFRVLNASNARTYRLAWRTAAGTAVPFTLIGNDGGLLPAPQSCTEAFLSTAERLDLLLDLRDLDVGDTVWLDTRSFDPMHMEMGAMAPEATGHEAMDHGAMDHSAMDHSAMDHAAMDHAGAKAGGATDHAAMHHGASFPEGTARTLLQLRVREKATYTAKVPARLSTLAPIATAGARERPFRLGFAKGHWRINDLVFVMGETPIEVKRNTVETWLIRNYFNSMPHAMHLHGFAFEVLARETSPDQLASLKIDDHGRLATDFGRKDTVLVWPGESVRLGIDFSCPFPGEQTYMFHCHNLEHEDGGMMLGVKVT